MVWADGIYEKQWLIDWVRTECGWELVITKRSDKEKGFKVVPKRWVVERTFAWLGRYHRLSKDYEKFARMVEDHWDGIASYCREENKVPLGFVAGINNKIRVIQRRAYGLRDEQYLRLKILTCMLPEI